MNISVDGGGLCLNTQRQFGNFTFSSNLLHALDLYDIENDYTVYTFDTCNFTQELSEHIRLKKLSPTKGWMKLRVSWEEMIRRKHIFLALNQALPIHTDAKIITFSHGLSFLRYPEIYARQYDRLHGQLKDFVRRSEWIVVS